MDGLSDLLKVLNNISNYLHRETDYSKQTARSIGTLVEVGKNGVQ
jgi:hypothetical protein